MRVDAETKRVAAEEARVQEFGELKTESETATEEAKKQANYAKEQGDNVAGTVEEIKTAQGGLETSVNDLTTVLNTQQGNRALYVAAGAKYNEETGFYELNGLTDITEEQMKLIYVESNPSKRMTDLCAIFNTSQIRTNFPFRVIGGYKQVDCHATFVNCDKLEVAALGISMGTVFYANRVHYMFQNCKKLHTVIGILRMDYSSEYTNMFSNCLALENVSLRGVKSDLSLVSSPLISLASLNFLIISNSNTSPITITVHADVFAKINDETNTEWHALLAAAEAKQITFATA